MEAEAPRAKSSPFSKQWWTRELSVLRTDLTMYRNRITTLRRRGQDTTNARQEAQVARRIYHNEIDRRKKQHWKDFLNDPGNIWKAARHAKTVNTAVDVRDLTVGARKYCTDEEKADLLMSTFFPKQPEPERATQCSPQHKRQRDNPTWPLLTTKEVERAIFRSSPDKGPGTDGITFRGGRSYGQK